MTPTSHPRRAFTLTEIAIVLGIIGVIVGAIWWGAYNVMQQRQVAQFGREIDTIVAKVDALYAANPGIFTFNHTCTCSNGGALGAGGVPAVCGWPLGAQTNVGWYCTAGAGGPVTSCMNPGAVLVPPSPPVVGSNDITRALVDNSVVPSEMLAGYNFTPWWDGCANGSYTIPAIQSPWGGKPISSGNYLCMSYGTGFSGAFCLVNNDNFNIAYSGAITQSACTNLMMQNMTSWVRMGLFQVRAGNPYPADGCVGWYGLTPSNMNTISVQWPNGGNCNVPPGVNLAAVSAMCLSMSKGANFGLSFTIPPPP